MPLSLIPLPQQIALTGGVFQISAGTLIISDEAALPEAQVLASSLRSAAGAALSVSRKVSSAAAIALQIDSALESLGREGYRLSITPEGVTLRAAERAGLFYGVQTLLQLADGDALPGAEIEDKPRFA